MDSLKVMQEQLREKNQKYNEMKQRFEASNEVITYLYVYYLCVCNQHACVLYVL